MAAGGALAAQELARVCRVRDSPGFAMRSWQWVALLGAGVLAGALSGAGAVGAGAGASGLRGGGVPGSIAGSARLDPGSIPATQGSAATMSVAVGAATEAEADAPAAPRAGELVRSGADPVEVPNPMASKAACPDDMVWVKGQYCTEVKQDCRVWLDDASLPFARCAVFASPAECVGRRVPMSFCIDRFEQTRPGEALPVNQMSFELGSRLCQGLGRRLCTEREWNFACEGEQMLPYPYGFARQPYCNQDRDDLLEMAFVNGVRQQVLKDLRRPGRLDSRCVSPFGVYDLVGNLDEPVLREAAQHVRPFRNALKGGWWMASRNRCRPATTSHDDWYQGTQVGVRCCADHP